jgi:hypothetical protein
MKGTIQLFVCIFAGHLLSSAQDSEKLEIPLISIQGRPVLEMYVNGKGPFKFIFDTGKMGDELATDMSVTGQFNFKVVDSLRMGDPSGQHDIILPVVQIPEVMIGSLKINNVRATINPRRMPGVNGIIGLAFFKDYLVTLDLSQNKMILAQGELAVPDGTVIVPYENMMGIPKVQLTMGGITADAHIDCGNARAGIVVPQSLADRLTFNATPVVSGMARTPFNEVQMMQGQMKGKLVLGSYSFDNPSISFPTFGSFVNLGDQFLRQFIFTFDQKNQRMKILKSCEWKN